MSKRLRLQSYADRHGPPVNASTDTLAKAKRALPSIALARPPLSVGVLLRQYLAAAQLPVLALQLCFCNSCDAALETASSLSTPQPLQA